MSTSEIEGLDKGIRPYVDLLIEHGVETFESCEGGDGHAFPVPTVRFHGDESEGWRVLAVVIRQGLPVADLRRYWYMQDARPHGPHWEMTFRGLP